MSNPVPLVEIKRGDFTNGFHSVHKGDDIEHARFLAAKTPKLKTQFVQLLIKGEVVLTRY